MLCDFDSSIFLSNCTNGAEHRLFFMDNVWSYDDVVALCCNFDISAHQLTRLKSRAENGHSDETCSSMCELRFKLNETVILDVINISVWLQGQCVEWYGMGLVRKAWPLPKSQVSYNCSWKFKFWQAWCMWIESFRPVLITHNGCPELKVMT